MAEKTNVGMAVFIADVTKFRVHSRSRNFFSRRVPTESLSSLVG